MIWRCEKEMKRKFAAVLLCAALTLLAGCSLTDSFSIFSSSQEETISLAALHPETPEVPTFQTPLLQLQSEPLLWARQQLPEELLETYDLLDQAIACHRETPVDISAEPEEIQLVLTALSMDRPEYFWFDGHASYVTTTSLLGEQTAVELTYTIPLTQAQIALQQVEDYASRCLSSPEVAGAQTDYDRIIAVYRYIINRTDYVLSEQDQSFLTVMTKGQGTCAGYARTFQYLMHRLNIPCTLALGHGEDGENHGWNVVYCDDSWYHIDVTWGDPVDASGTPGHSLEYTYCMLTDEEIYSTHTPDKDIPLPLCEAQTYNYYRKSGLQLSSWDSVKYETLMRSALTRGDSWLTVRFDTPEAHQAAMNALITNSGIMTILKNCGVEIPQDGVTYSHNDLYCEFSVKISY